MRLKIYSPALFACLTAAILPVAAHAQAGPPFLSNDPGTPGNGNWEINVGSMQTVTRFGASYQVPQLDVNYGLGDRIQLTYLVPYVIQTSGGGNVHEGWGNASPGVKWRFLDQGEEGWQLSTFPQAMTGVSVHAEQEGIAQAGPRYLLPVEVTHPVGPIGLDFEAGYIVPARGPHESILGLVAGHRFSPRLELCAELYDDHVYEADGHTTTWDVGGRYKLHRSFILLFMAGRSLDGTAAGQPQYMGYVGLQILLSHYGLALGSEE